MKIRFTFFLFLIVNLSAVSQSPLYMVYDWDETPAIHKIPETHSAFPAVFVMHNRFIELRVKNNSARSYSTEHKIIHVNSSAGIEKYNKVYIPMGGSRELVSLNVRSIAPDGSITILKKENLKELSNIEGYGSFKIFAIEGLQVGGELECIYTTESAPQPYGREVFQHEVPVMDANFQLIYPAHFSFELKSYNGLPKPIWSTYDKNRKSYHVGKKNIPALTEEEYSSHKANLMRVDFKLDETPVGRAMLEWEDLSERILKQTFSSKGYVQVEKMLRSLVHDNFSPVEKIQAVERHIKTNFTVKEGYNEAYEDSKEVMEKRVANERGITKIYMACWALLNIDAQLVMATNRYQGTLDPQFSTPLDLDEVLFYFPASRQYLVPGVSYMRLGPAPQGIANSNALFMSYTIERASIQFDSYDIRKIDPLDYSHNKMGVRARVSLNDLGAPEVMQENYCQGYRAAQFRGYYYLLSNADKEKFVRENVLSAIDNASIIKLDVEGTDLDLSFDVDSYFTTKTHYQASSLIEKAGEDYLFSIGRIIGKQSELYQEKVRQTDVTFPTTSNYDHEIVLDIPPGFECSGLDEIRISHEVIDETDVVMKFQSDYRLENNKLIVTVKEYYKVLHLPKEKYEDFRKVVNAAADFNKLVVILHPIPE